MKIEIIKIINDTIESRKKYLSDKNREIFEEEIIELEDIRKEIIKNIEISLHNEPKAKIKTNGGKRKCLEKTIAKKCQN